MFENIIFPISIIVMAILVMGAFFKRKKSEYGKRVPKEYTVFITDEFTKEDAKYMRPIFTIVFEEGKNREEAILCKVLDGNGEVTLKEAEEIMLDNIKNAFESEVYKESIVHNTDLIQEEEEHTINNLNDAIKKQKKM